MKEFPKKIGIILDASMTIPANAGNIIVNTIFIPKLSKSEYFFLSPQKIKLNLGKKTSVIALHTLKIRSCTNNQKCGIMWL